MTAQALDIQHTADMPMVQPRNVITATDMLSQALASGAGVEVIEKLMALRDRQEATMARRAFDEALAAAKAEIPVIAKNRVVDFTSSRGRTHYAHEDLGEIARTVDPILGKYGLSYRFRVKTEQGQVHVTCIVAHRDGHFEETTLSAGHDQSGNKNSIQAVGSTITYLQRYTLKAALGLAASADDDGQSHDKPQTAPECISEEQLQTIRRLIEETDTDIEKFCELGEIDALPDMLAKDFDNAVRLLEQKKQRMAK
jgi:hypothetical protein